ncbi:MAG: hypothetical protein ACRD07_16250 [Acidimicrobiales bacterium]
MAQVGSSVRHNRDAASPAHPSGDWATQAADTIERAVGNVRDRTARPALTVARAVVYGTFAALVGLAALVLGTIAAVRLIDNYLPDAVFGDEHTWAAHLIIGLVFVLAGGVLWVRRRGAGPEDRPA